jgi:uncharacterized protein
MRIGRIILLPAVLAGAAWGDVSTARTGPGPRTSLVDETESYYRQGVDAAGGNAGLRDYVRAAVLYRRSAEAGHTGAIYSLAYLFENGLGVAQDYAQAAAWYRKGAERGDAECQNNLGGLYASGLGVARDETEAARWYGKSAAQSDVARARLHKLLGGGAHVHEGR